MEKSLLWVSQATAFCVCHPWLELDIRNFINILLSQKWHRSRFHVAVIQLLILALRNCALAPWADDVSAKLIQRVTLNQTQVSTVWPQDWFNFLSEVDRPISAFFLNLILLVPWELHMTLHNDPSLDGSSHILSLWFQCQEFPGKDMDKLLTILPRFSSQVHEETSYSNHREILPVRQPFFVLDYLF